MAASLLILLFCLWCSVLGSGAVTEHRSQPVARQEDFPIPAAEFRLEDLLALEEKLLSVSHFSRSLSHAFIPPFEDRCLHL